MCAAHCKGTFRGFSEHPEPPNPLSVLGTGRPREDGDPSAANSPSQKIGCYSRGNSRLSVSPAGIGGALTCPPSLALVARYFKRRRALANSVVFSGAGVSALMFSPLFQFLVDAYGWRGALLVVAGLVFNLVAFGALLRPLDSAGTGASSAGGGQSCGGRLASLLGLGLLRHRAFLTFSGAGVLITAGYFIPFVHLVPLAREVGFDEYQAAFLVSAVGTADIAGRVTAGWLADRGSLRLYHHLLIWAVLTGLASLALPLGHSYALMTALSICYGFVASAVVPLKFSSLMELVDAGQIMGAIGLLHLLESVGALGAAPLSGEGGSCGLPLVWSAAVGLCAGGRTGPGHPATAPTPGGPGSERTVPAQDSNVCLGGRGEMLTFKGQFKARLFGFRDLE